MFQPYFSLSHPCSNTVRLHLFPLEAVLNLSCDDLGWSEKDQKIAQSTHENGYIKPRKTFWRNSKQLLRLWIK